MAHKLRKTYPGRLSLAVFSPVGLTIVLSFFFLSENSLTSFTRVHFKAIIPGKKLSSLHELSEPALKNVKMHQRPVRNISKRVGYVNGPQRIIGSNNINNLPATSLQVQPSLTRLGGTAVNLSLNEDIARKGGSYQIDNPVKAYLPGPDGHRRTPFISEKKYSIPGRCGAA